MKQYLIFLFICSVFAGAVKGQNLSSVQYDTDEGIPSSEVYDVVQDLKGYIWIATDRGLSRYDGYSFTNFTMNDGLTDNVIFNIYPDKSGRLWFNTFNGKLCYFENDKFKPFEWNDSIKKYAPKATFLRSLHVSEDGTLLLGFHHGPEMCISKTGHVTVKNQKGMFVYYVYADSETNGFATGKYPDSAKPALRLNNKLLLRGFPKETELEFPAIMPIAMPIVTCVRANKSICCAIGEHLFLIDSTGKYATFNFQSVVLRINEDRESRLWISFVDGGVACYSPDEIPLAEPEKIFFKGEKITCVYEDMEGGFWFSTLKSGLFYCSSTEVEIHLPDYPNSSGVGYLSVNSIQSGRILTVEKSNRIFSYSNQKWAEFRMPEETYAEETQIKAIYYDSVYSRLWMGYAGLKGGVYSSDSSDHIKKVVNGYSNGFAVAGDSVYILMSLAVARMSLSDFSDQSTRLEYHSRPEAIYAGRNGKIWVAGRNGLSYLSGRRFFLADSTNPLLTLKMLCMTGLPDGRLVIGTIEKGLIIYDPVRQICDTLSEGNGLPSNVVNALYVDAYGKIWAGTNQGICEITLAVNRKHKIRVYNYTNGLPADDIHSVCINNGWVWAAAGKSLVSFKFESIKENQFPPPVYISRVYNGDSLISESGIEFAYGNIAIRFQYTGINYHSQGKVKYRYELDGLPNFKSQYTNNREAFFLSLDPGTYTFSVWAINENGIESTKPATFTFTIRPPFWKTTWFWLAASLIIGLIALLLVRQYINGLKKENEMNELLMESRQQALANQMNPHFIFNSLNAIQSYIMREDKIAATRYLSRFSKLMRLSLDHSREKMISLAEEIDMISVYLELEKMRFSDRLDSEIHVEESIDQVSVQVPSMLIQPYVENAIRHGIMHREESGGKVSLHLYMKEGSLYCEVEDNGVGREYAEQKKQEREGKHHSAGTTITGDRLRLLCHDLNKEFYFKVTDKKNEQGKAIGTKICFIIPFVYAKNTSNRH
jgi:ligand-binding sensor domain-containing protein/anti-sigma regulatory factor (Ser/Thr protein kinase)